MKAALDSNVLLYWLRYARNPQDEEKVASARAFIPKLRTRSEVVVPWQVLGEAYNVLTRSQMPRTAARTLVQSASMAFETLSPGATSYYDALDLAADHKLQVWDALIIRIAAEADCALLLSEDMQDGFTVGGLTVANPFAAVLHPRLAALLNL